MIQKPLNEDQISIWGETFTSGTQCSHCGFLKVKQKSE